MNDGRWKILLYLDNPFTKVMETFVPLTVDPRDLFNLIVPSIGYSLHLHDITDTLREHKRGK